MYRRYKDSWHSSHGGWGVGEIGEKKEDMKGKGKEGKTRGKGEGGEGTGRPGKMEDYGRKRSERDEEKGAWEI